MKIKFGNSKPKVHHSWEVYSPNAPIHVKKKYWQTYSMADSYAKILRQRHDDRAFAVRWCRRIPKKPIKHLETQ